MKYDELDDEYEDIDLKWADFWSRNATDYENHSTYNPCIVRTSGYRKPGYDMPHSVGVRECTVA